MRDPTFYLGAAAISVGMAAMLAALFTPWVRVLALKQGGGGAPR